ncbi:MAG: DUF4062 domain-containing protein, partial [Methanobrevibacter sp.]|nr:DUF4062 domain-containing protein [Methanobrevibacter sp.]
MDWKRVTIFISSTFNDMHGERDYLVKFVFPELQEWAYEHKIHLVDVDLRWGVTTKDTENGNTLGTCLKNIDDSRPFFLCFLGQRRGWVPNPKVDISKNTPEVYPEICDRLDDKSVTEAETEHALLAPMYRILDNLEKKHYSPVEHSLFFFREDNYSENLSDSQKLIYTNESERNDKLEYRDNKYYKNSNSDERVKHADEKLEEFKATIRKTHQKVFNYNGTWDFEHIVPELSHKKDNSQIGGFKNFNYRENTLKDKIIQELKKEIFKAYPDHENIGLRDDLEIEIDNHDLIRELNTQGFIPRETSFKQLDDFLNSNDSLCVLTAKAGLGKTTLLANYITTLKEKDLNVYYRFSGISSESGDSYSIWKNILKEAKIPVSEDEKSIESWIPNLEELEKNQKEVLNRLANEKETVVIIDGINQLSDGLNMINWLEKDLNPNLKIVLSLKEDETEKVQNLIKLVDKDEKIAHLEVDEIKDNEAKKEIINKYLNQFLKDLDTKHINSIINTNGSENPLFLKILLTELRTFGQYDKLNEEIKKFTPKIPIISQLLALPQASGNYAELKKKIAKIPATPEKAFQTVLKKLENEESYTNIQSNVIVPLIFGLLANARYGLTEEELVHCIQKETSFNTDEINEDLKIIIRQVRPFMVKKGQIHDFFYDSFKIAAQEKYKNNKIHLNEILSDYFQKQADPGNNYEFTGSSKRAFSELPYHLCHGEKREELEKILSKYLWIHKKIELFDIYDTIKDYKYLKNEPYHLKLIKECLILSSHILKGNKELLTEQLWGRMKDINNEEIKNLLEESQNNTKKPWLKPLSTYLDPPGGPLIRTLKGHTDSVFCVVFSPDGKSIVSASADGTLKVWDSQSGEEIRTLTGHRGALESVVFSPDGKTIVSASGDKTLKVWDSQSGEEIRTLTG